MNLLIADDDVTTRSTLEAMTARLGFAVTSVSDGDEAWRALRGAEAPMLALLDWNMPGLDGLEVIRNLRLETPRNASYLILLTASQEKDGVIEALQAGANDFIRKPCDMRELQARLTMGAQALQGQAALSECRAQLQEALTRIAGLQTLLHDCTACPGLRLCDGLR
jgi:DNA-binding response OmpR family regulator